MNEGIDAEVMVVVKFSNVCNREDLETTTLEEMVRALVSIEGIGILFEDDHPPQIVSVKEWRS